MSTTDTYTASDTWIAPAGVTSVDVECWGAGGSGASSGSTASATGAGGGAYSKKLAITVVPGNSYTVTVGVGGTTVTNVAGNSGGDSWFSTTGTVLAKGGQGGNLAIAASGGLGGATAAGVGDTKFRGGNGGDTNGGSTSTAGGGGAGDAANGGDVTLNSSTPGTGGTSGGGTGGNPVGPVAATTIGGGGYGRGGSNPSGVGARGEVRVTHATVFSTSVSDTQATVDTLIDFATYVVSIANTITVVDLSSVVRNIWRNLSKVVSTTWTNLTKN